MSINTLAMATKMTEELDKAIVQKAVTGFLADNALGAKFVGAKTVSIPDVVMDGLGDYDRDGGFPQGGVTVARKTYTLTMDRGLTFQIDAQDNDEVGVANLAGQVAGEFVRTKVVPEVDAYVLSKLAALANTKSHTVSIGSGSTLEADCYKMFNKALMGVQEACGFDGTELVAFVSPTFWAALNNSTAFTRQILTSDFKRGELTTQVKSINGCALLPVSSDRMKNSFTFYDGKTDTSASSGTNQKPGGFVPASGAKGVGLIIVPKNIGGLVKKTEKVRIFAPGENLTADAYKIDYRIYFDMLVPKKREGAVYAYIEA